MPYPFGSFTSFMDNSYREHYVGKSTGYQKFAIFAHPRSGSAMLADLIDSHPSAICHKECFTSAGIFHRGFDNLFRIPVNDRSLSQKTQIMLLKFARRVNRTSFLDRTVYHAAAPHISVVGTKFLIPRVVSYSDLWPRLFKGDIKVIILQRKNILRTHLSLKLAEKLNKFHFREGEKVEVQQISFSMPEFVQFTKSIEKGFSDLRARAESLQLIELFYEDLLVDTSKILEVLDFLNLSHENLQTPLVKPQPKSIEHIVDNFDELHTELRGTKWEEFIYYNEQAGISSIGT